MVQRKSVQRGTWAVLGAAALLFTGEAFGQVYRCISADGQTVFSDRPCASDAVVHELPRVPQPEEASRDREPRQGRAPTQAELDYLQDREIRRQEAQERQQRIREADDRVRQIRADSYDPQKCAEARSRIANYQRRDPLGASYSPDVMEWRQWESLYCGPNQPLIPPTR